MLKIEYVKKEDLKPYANNAKIHTAEQVEQIKKSIKEFGFNDPVAVWHDNEVIEGHGRLMAVMDMDEITDVPIIRLDNLTDEERKAYMLVHNKLTMNTDFDSDLLDIELGDILDIDMSEFGFEMYDPEEEVGEHTTLSEEFIVPPFSVLDTRKEYWQKRKRAWKSLGIKSELGREDNLLKMSKTIQKQGLSTSIFDPVLCEIVYKWFSPDGGKIYDPFAGGSVRGVVAEYLGYNYTGIDLRQEQVDANAKNAQEIGVAPKWICDDSFAVFVVGDIRDKKGFYRNFIDYTTECFLKSGMQKYNEMILLDSTGSASLRARKMFSSNRKVCKVHQNVLVFYKGDPKKIKENYSEIEIDESLFDEE